MCLSRRQFLKVSAGTVAAVAVADQGLALTALQPVIEVGNPLGTIRIGPGSGSITTSIGTIRRFTWVCSPNDTARLPHPGLRPQRRRDAGGTELRSPDL